MLNSLLQILSWVDIDNEPFGLYFSDELVLHILNSCFINSSFQYRFAYFGLQ